MCDFRKLGLSLRSKSSAAHRKRRAELLATHVQTYIVSNDAIRRLTELYDMCIDNMSCVSVRSRDELSTWVLLPPHDDFQHCDCRPLLMPPSSHTHHTHSPLLLGNAFHPCCVTNHRASLPPHPFRRYKQSRRNNIHTTNLLFDIYAKNGHDDHTKLFLVRIRPACRNMVSLYTDKSRGRQRNNDLPPHVPQHSAAVDRPPLQYERHRP